MLKKILLAILFFFISTLTLHAQTLEGQVTYTVDTARVAAFEGINKKIDMTQFENHQQDPNRTENMKALETGTSFKDRCVQYFKGMPLKAYAVNYYDNPKYTYYYPKFTNQLAFVDIDESNGRTGTKFPFRTLRYDFRGRLIAVGIYVSPEERFLYKQNGKLISHWIGNYGYNARGRQVGEIEGAEY